jgi:hypothetical protein
VHLTRLAALADLYPQAGRGEESKQAGEGTDRVRR